jgi:hypothetical protein
MADTRMGRRSEPSVTMEASVKDDADAGDRTQDTVLRRA